MNGKDLKRNSYWLKERYKKTIEVKNSKLEDLQTTENLNKLEVCSFVQKCITIAQEKKIMENGMKNLTATKEYSFQGMFSKFEIILCL